MKKIFIALLVLTSCGGREVPSRCRYEQVNSKYNELTKKYDDLFILYCNDTAYYLLEDKLLYKFPVKK